METTKKMTTITTITRTVTTSYPPIVRHTGSILMGSTILGSTTIPIHPLLRGGKEPRLTIRPESTILTQLPRHTPTPSIHTHLPLHTPTPTASTTRDTSHMNLIHGKVTLTRRSRLRNQLQAPL